MSQAVGLRLQQVVEATGVRRVTLGPVEVAQALFYVPAQVGILVAQLGQALLMQLLVAPALGEGVRVELPAWREIGEGRDQAREGG